MEKARFLAATFASAIDSLGRIHIAYQLPQTLLTEIHHLVLFPG